MLQFWLAFRYFTLRVLKSSMLVYVPSFKFPGESKYLSAKQPLYTGNPPHQQSLLKQLMSFTVCRQKRLSLPLTLLLPPLTTRQLLFTSSTYEHHIKHRISLILPNRNNKYNYDHKQQFPLLDFKVLIKEKHLKRKCLLKFHLQKYMWQCS